MIWHSWKKQKTVTEAVHTWTPEKSLKEYIRGGVGCPKTTAMNRRPFSEKHQKVSNALQNAAVLLLHVMSKLKSLGLCASVCNWKCWFLSPQTTNGPSVQCFDLFSLGILPEGRFGVLLWVSNLGPVGCVPCGILQSWWQRGSMALCRLIFRNALARSVDLDYLHDSSSAALIQGLLVRLMVFYLSLLWWYMSLCWPWMKLCQVWLLLRDTKLERVLQKSDFLATWGFDL